MLYDSEVDLPETSSPSLLRQRARQNCSSRFCVCLERILELH